MIASFPRLYLSASKKSSGKTTIATGIAAAIEKKGMRVQGFKKGPDYIDPMWLARGSERPVYNLDYNTMSEQEILQCLSKTYESSDIALIEGNKGLFDGVAMDGSDSNAALAKQLNTPVVLILDVTGITRGIAPLLLGYKDFDPEILFAGVILNNVGGQRHESKLLQVIEHYTDFEILGMVQRDKSLSITERHLGLTTDKEISDVDKLMGRLAEAMASQISISRLVEIAQSAPAIRISSDPSPVPGQSNVRIGIARDAAFCFYYQDDLEAMEKRGVGLIYFDTLSDTVLPDVDALFIGGGFPEMHLAALEKNSCMKQAISRFAASGRPIYAECGGLMYLSQQITWGNQSRKMVGLLPAKTQMHDRPVGRGYVKITPSELHPWALSQERALNAHEFHYSTLENLQPDSQFAFQVNRGHGVDGKVDGLVCGNVLASYSHLRNTKSCPWVDHFIRAVQQNKDYRGSSMKKVENVA